MVSCTVLANLFLKAGAHASHDRWLFGSVGTYTIVGAVFFASAFVFYTWVLKFIPLNLAMSLTAIQLIGVILASALVLGEPIPLMRWVGIALICGGIIVVGSTTGE